MRVILVHGINTKGTKNTDRLAAALVDRGLRVLPVKYAPVNAITAPRRAPEIARQVRNYALPGDAIVAHSFGCLVAYTAMEQGARFGPVVFFSAAMEQEVCFPADGMKALLNVTHPYDKALTVGKWLPWHPFGLLGRDGYAGVIDSRITEEQSTAEVGKYNHSAPYFSPEHVDFWADRVRDFLKQHPSAD